MKSLVMAVLLAGLALGLAGCKPSSAPVSSANVDPRIPTHAQGKLPTLKLWIGSKEMNAEMAVSMIEENTGMMFRTNMADNDGMIFVLPKPMKASFWMMNTCIPLSAAYLAPDGTILEIHDLKPLDTNAVDAQSDNIQFVLETKQGWFKTNHIDVGTVIGTDRGTLHKVFFAPY